jgi:hypothetical protein
MDSNAFRQQKEPPLKKFEPQQGKRRNTVLPQLANQDHFLPDELLSHVHTFETGTTIGC